MLSCRMASATNVILLLGQLPRALNSHKEDSLKTRNPLIPKTSTGAFGGCMLDIEWMPWHPTVKKACFPHKKQGTRLHCAGCARERSHESKPYPLPLCIPQMPKTCHVTTLGGREQCQVFTKEYPLDVVWVFCAQGMGVDGGGLLSQQHPLHQSDVVWVGP